MSATPRAIPDLSELLGDLPHDGRSDRIICDRDERLANVRLHATDAGVGDLIEVGDLTHGAESTPAIGLNPTSRSAGLTDGAGRTTGGGGAGTTGASQ